MSDIRHYETTIIINGSLEEKQISDAVERTTEFLQKNGANIQKADHWGRRRMTYQINKRNNGYYVQFAYDAPGEIVKLIARFCHIDDDILRELTLMLTERDLQKREETRAKIAAAEAAVAAGLAEADEEGDVEDSDDV